MALIDRLRGMLTGRGEADAIIAALRAQIAAQGGGAAFGLSGRQLSAWDRLMDALNRLPRPLMALGTLALIAAALIAPDWFAARMETLAAMPEPLWWLIGAVVSLFFGARFQAHEQAFARELLAAVPPPEPLRTADTGTDAALTLAVETPADNPALAAWEATRTPS